jgi:hypothetical protein
MAVRWLPMLLGSMMLTLAGCGGDGSGGGAGSGGDAGYVTAPPAEPTPEPGCSEAHPKRLRRTGDLASFLRACVSEDHTSLWVTNTSSTVLLIRPADGSRPEMEAVTGEESSFADQMVNEVEPAICFGPGNACRLPPKGHLTAESASPPRVVVSLDPESTAVVTAASTFGGWVKSKLQTKAGSYVGSIKACASDVGRLAQQHQPVEDTINAAVASGGDCTSLVRQVQAELREPVPPAAATDDVLKLAGRFTGNLRRDLYAYGALRLLTHR